MKTHHVLAGAGVALLLLAFVKFVFLGFAAHEGAIYAGVAVLGAGALVLADLVKERHEEQRFGLRPS